jgi:uncharacterized protein
MEIKRALYNMLLKDLLPGKVNILYGARRVGKTFLLRKVCSEAGFTFLWLNGEDEETASVLKLQNTSTLKRLIGDVQLLVIDEAQAVPGIGKTLKLMVDEMPHLRMIASGSSAFDLHNYLGEPLVGRAYWHEMLPVAQMELKNHETLIETRQRLTERLIYGSYPEVLTLDSFEQKERYLRDMVQAYLLKDILNFEGIRNASKILDLLRLIAFQIGSEVSMHELGQQLGMSKNTVEKYLNLLEKVYVLRKISGFNQNLRKEIAKSPRYYFWDNGVRNAILNDFKMPDFRNDIGQLWENYLLSERAKKLKYRQIFKEIYFWRTYDQQEIDSIEVRNREIEAYEFKWQVRTVKIPSAFAANYPDASFKVIHRDNYLDFIEDSIA